MTAEGRARVTVVTNGNYFAALALAPLLRRRDLDLQVIVTTGLRRQTGNRLVEAGRLLRTWGPRYFAYKGVTYVVPVALESAARRPSSVRAWCRRLGVPVLALRNVNREEGMAAVKAFGPDLLVSVSCPYRIRPPLLALSRVGNLNLHSSLLPAYAGIGTYIHVLARGEPRTGVTVHEMVEEFDAGRIVASEAVPIDEPTSVFALFSQLCTVGGRLLDGAVDACLAAGAVVGAAQDPAGRSYFGEPTAAEVRDLRARGHRLLTGRDLARALARSSTAHR